jgi:hypothetical protein
MPCCLSPHCWHRAAACAAALHCIRRRHVPVKA